MEGHLVPVEIFLWGDYKVSFVKHGLLTFQNRLRSGFHLNTDVNPGQVGLILCWVTAQEYPMLYKCVT